jgi:uncharacterized protein (TIGR03083 family)
MAIDSYLSAATTVSTLLRSPSLAEAWDQPSALPEFRIGGLAGHLARAVFTTEGYVAAEVPPHFVLVDAGIYLGLLETMTPEDNARVVHRGEAEAGTGPGDLIARYDAALDRLRATLPTLGEDRPVPMLAGHVLPLRECLVTRMLELLVHADDLAVSLGEPTPEFDEEAADLVVTLLARFARRRHGLPAMLRALARRERAGESIAAF